jgi:hypothetical protein
MHLMNLARITFLNVINKIIDNIKIIGIILLVDVSIIQVIVIKEKLSKNTRSCH